MSISPGQKEQIIQLVKEAGKVMLSARNVEDDEDNISSKYGTANFVTVFDVKVQNMLIDGFCKIVPGSSYLAEEKDNSGIDITKGLTFIIDPIDGTTNFIHDMRASAISVGFFEFGEPVFSVIHDPYRNEMFLASKGEGAFLNGRKIGVSDRELNKALVAFGTSPYNRDTLGSISFSMARNIYMQTADLRRSGSAAIDICNVACGREDGFFEIILSPWDFAGGSLILTEAGGMLTDFDGNVPSFSKPSSVLCSNKIVHNQLLDIIKKSEDEFYGR